MTKTHRFIIPLIFALFICISGSFAQSPLREADYAFRDCQYEKALELYQKGMKKVGKNQIEVRRATFYIAECYRIMGNLKKAEQQYIRLEKRNYQKDNPECGKPDGKCGALGWASVLGA